MKIRGLKRIYRRARKQGPDPAALLREHGCRCAEASPAIQIGTRKVRLAPAVSVSTIEHREWRRRGRRNTRRPTYIRRTYIACGGCAREILIVNGVPSRLDHTVSSTAQTP